MTPRNRVMFGAPGIAYVYFVYGMHHCLNAVTEAEGTGAAVLIRGARAAEGDPRWEGLRLDGPGRLCRAFGIDLRMNGWDLTSSSLRVLDAPDVADASVRQGPRVGISRAVDLELRFRLGG